MTDDVIKKLVLVAATFSLGLTGCLSYMLHRTPDAACKQRAAAYSARTDTLRKDASEQLKIGTRKEEVARFFQQHGLPVDFAGGEASGTIHVSGCAPSGCGSDDALLGLRVKVDAKGTVIGEPVVGAIYTNCL